MPTSKVKFIKFAIYISFNPRAETTRYEPTGLSRVQVGA